MLQNSNNRTTCVWLIILQLYKWLKKKITEVLKKRKEKSHTDIHTPEDKAI